MPGASESSADIRLLFTTRILRMFAYGFMSVILVLYLEELGFAKSQIGLLLSCTLLGDTAISLWITLTADRVGRKRMLILGAALMLLGGALFAGTSNFALLLLGATLGVLSPGGNEVGPFLAIEQAALIQEVPAERRTGLLAWYQLAGSFATAAGALACGQVLELLQASGLTQVASFQLGFLSYAALGAVLCVLFTRLSRASEVATSGIAGGAPVPQARFGLHRSRGVVLKLAALFALDAFAGGFVLQSVMAAWFHERFDADLKTLGAVFFAANLVAGFSGLAAAALARRIGLINTMVLTHVPSNILLILVPFMPTLVWAMVVLLMRFAISQMDVPTRQSYTAAVVDPDERSAAAGVTGVARSVGAALAPALAGVLFARLAGAPFVAAGMLKLVYDGLLYHLFRKAVPPEERSITSHEQKER
jgi:MFS family permease